MQSEAYVEQLLFITQLCGGLGFCVNDLQLLMKSCRDVSNNDSYDEIHQKAADMASPEKVSMPLIVKHQTFQQNHRRISIFATSTTHFWTV